MCSSARNSPPRRNCLSPNGDAPHENHTFKLRTNNIVLLLLYRQWKSHHAHVRAMFSSNCPRIVDGAPYPEGKSAVHLTLGSGKVRKIRSLSGQEHHPLYLNYSDARCAHPLAHRVNHSKVCKGFWFPWHECGSASRCSLVSGGNAGPDS